MESKFVVRCKVSGGVTGTREALLKRNDRIVYFETRQEAEAEATRLRLLYNNERAVAFFQYWAEEAPSAEWGTSFDRKGRAIRVSIPND